MRAKRKRERENESNSKSSGDKMRIFYVDDVKRNGKLVDFGK